jgi:hypothetical protein
VRPSLPSSARSIPASLRDEAVQTDSVFEFDRVQENGNFGVDSSPAWLDEVTREGVWLDEVGRRGKEGGWGATSIASDGRCEGAVGVQRPRFDHG